MFATRRVTAAQDALAAKPVSGSALRPTSDEDAGRESPSFH